MIDFKLFSVLTFYVTFTVIIATEQSKTHQPIFTPSLAEEIMLTQKRANITFDKTAPKYNYYANHVEQQKLETDLESERNLFAHKEIGTHTQDIDYVRGKIEMPNSVNHHHLPKPTPSVDYSNTFPSGYGSGVYSAGYSPYGYMSPFQRHMARKQAMLAKRMYKKQANFQKFAYMLSPYGYPNRYKQMRPSPYYPYPSKKKYHHPPPAYVGKINRNYHRNAFKSPITNYRLKYGSTENYTTPAYTTYPDVHQNVYGNNHHDHMNGFYPIPRERVHGKTSSKSTSGSEFNYHRGSDKEASWSFPSTA